MNEKLLIRSTALLLLKEIYLKCDGDLLACINPFDITDKNIDKLMIKKAESYLKEKQLVIGGDIIDEKWTISITYRGIDWLEDNYNINPTSYTGKKIEPFC